MVAGADSLGARDGTAHRILHFDQTGVTAETLGHSLLTVSDLEFRRVTVPFVDNEARAHDLGRSTPRLNEEERPIVFSSLVHGPLREIIRTADGLYLDIFDALVGALETELSTKASHAGRARHVRYRDLHETDRGHELRAGQR